MSRFSGFLAILIGLVLASSAHAQATATHVKKKVESNDAHVVYVPTPHDVVNTMLQLAEVKKDDLLYDLGCGDGRIVVQAARKLGCKAVGVDIDAARIAECHQNAKKAKVEPLTAFLQKDIFELDLSKANVVTLYLLPELNVKLIPQLQELKPGSRIVSHDFDMAGVDPVRTVTIKSKEDNVEHTLYLWITPLKVKSSEASASQ